MPHDQKAFFKVVLHQSKQLLLFFYFLKDPVHQIAWTCFETHAISECATEYQHIKSYALRHFIIPSPASVTPPIQYVHAYSSRYRSPVLHLECLMSCAGKVALCVGMMDCTFCPILKLSFVLLLTTLVSTTFKYCRPCHKKSSDFF